MIIEYKDKRDEKWMDELFNIGLFITYLDIDCPKS